MTAPILCGSWRPEKRPLGTHEDKLDREHWAELYTQVARSWILPLSRDARNSTSTEHDTSPDSHGRTVLGHDGVVDRFSDSKTDQPSRAPCTQGPATERPGRFATPALMVVSTTRTTSNVARPVRIA